MQKYFLMLILSILASNCVLALNFITREEWKGIQPKSVVYFKGPAPYVIIHHSYSPGYCGTTDECKRSVRSIQTFHMKERKWEDIGYSFLIGGDGNVYIGRGFNVVGAHAPRYNDKSIGICLIGDYQNKLPPIEMLNAAKELISYSMKNGYLSSDFKLLGHRQVRDTTCPGDSLFKEIQTWSHFSPNP